MVRNAPELRQTYRHTQDRDLDIKYVARKTGLNGLSRTQNVSRIVCCLAGARQQIVLAEYHGE